MHNRWNIQEADNNTVAALQDTLKISHTLCKILVQRGIETFDEARDFFRPQLAHLHNPWRMKDMHLAVERVMLAIEKNEKILVFGDYDVDGTTAVACMYRFLKSQHPAVDFYIPNRYKEGYGISRAGIDFAKENRFGLVIALDCGIKSVELIDDANRMGLDFIICDHHLPDEKIPQAVAVLNPKQADCPYPYKELCGCGVGFKLICALTEKMGLPMSSAYEYLDLVATAIAADIVPITGENRILAFHGLKKANENPNAGIKALCTLSAIKLPIRIGNLVFMIAPRINAAGRMDDARKAVQMFIAGTETEAMRFAEMLHSDNTERKEADSSITQHALEMIGQEPEWKHRKSTVVFHPHWHKGVVGIVASRLIENYYRPTVVLTQSGDYVAGSARSVPGFNLYEAIHACRDLLLGYGGHFAAAGLSMAQASVGAFREKFEQVVSATIDPALLIPELVIDAEIELKQITPAFYNIIQQMEPFGPENMTPVFLARNVYDTGFSRIVKEDHLRFVVQQGATTLTGIGFNMADKFALIEKRQPFDIVFKIDENEWGGNKTLQLKVEDLREAVST